MVDAGMDSRIRASMFAWLDANAQPDGTFTWAKLQRHFMVDGQPFALITQNGIRKPRALEAAIAFSTTYTPAGSAAPYNDAVGSDGLVRYKYRRPGRSESDNIGLRTAGERGLPLAWFVGVATGVFVAHRPVFVVDDDPVARQFSIDLEGAAVEEVPAIAPRREYAERLTRLRLHQPIFRAQVLRAYEQQCTVCRLRHGRLLDAAHILADSAGGQPVVTNGMSMCKIHHAAYDGGIMSVRPDYTVEVREDVLAETDGPMLLHGLQQMHESLLALPRRVVDLPDRDALAARHATFKRTA